MVKARALAWRAAFQRRPRWPRLHVALSKRMSEAGRGWPSFEAVFYEGLGHNRDLLEAAARSQSFLVRHMFREPTAGQP